ncbi:MAG: trigger factor [Candidatus Caldatribacteriaceae bacterium]
MVEVKKEEKEKHVYSLEVTVDEVRVQEALQEIYRDFSFRVNIPGFRKGKAPRNILRAYVGKGVILDALAQSLIPKITREVLERENIEVIGEPEMEVLQIDEEKPLIFRLQVMENPEVEIPDPENLEVRKYKLEVRESDVEKELERLRNSKGKWEDKQPESAVSVGDLVKFKVEDRDYTVLAHDTENGDVIGREVLGMKAGETKRVSLKDQEGKDVELELQVTKVMEKKVPEIDPEFLQSLGEEFDSVEVLKEKIRERLELVAKDLVEDRFQQEAVVALGKGSRVHIPDSLVNIETRHRIDEFREQLQKDGLTLEKYLELTGHDFASVEQELRKAASWGLKKFFILQEYARKYDIKVTEEDLNKELERLARISGKTKDEVREILSRNDKIGEVQERLKNQKILQDLAARVKARELSEAINFDQWRALENPEEEVMV